MVLHIATGMIKLMSHIDAADGSHLRVIRLADRGEGPFEFKLHTHFQYLTWQANHPKKTAFISLTTSSSIGRANKGSSKAQLVVINLQPALMQDNGFDRIGFELIGGILHTNVGIAILEVPYL